MAERKEELVGIPGQVAIGIVDLPDGKKGVGMVYEGKNWILISSFSKDSANKLRDDLSKRGLETTIGLPIDLEQTLKKEEIVILDPPNGELFIGVYLNSKDNLGREVRISISPVPKSSR